MAARRTEGGRADSRAARRREVDDQVAAMPPVRLRPVLGVAPTTYLTGGLGLVVLIALFLVLILPGIRFNGTVVHVTSAPPGAAVHLDGEFAGTTPAELRVPRGAHRLLVSRPYFRPAELPLEVTGRVFGSWIVPRRAGHHVVLAIDDVEGFLDAAVADFAASPLLAPSVHYAAAALPDSHRESHREASSRFVHNFIHYVTSGSPGEALDAAFLSIGGPDPASANGIAGFVSFIARATTAAPGGAALLAKAAPPGLRAALVQSDWFRAWRESQERRLRDVLSSSPTGGPAVDDGPTAGRTLAVRTLTFREIPPSRFVMGDSARIDGFADRAAPVEEMPHVVDVPRFLAGTREVSRRDFVAFVEANSRWAPSNRAALVAEGLASADYLGDWADGSPRADTLDHPVTYVSFHAAQAYAAWISEHPAVRGAGLVARLPYEPEWELAARGGLPASRYPTGSEARTARVGTPRGGPAAVGFSAPNGYGLQDTIGNVWEWTGDWYAPNTYYLRGPWERDYGPDRRLRVGAERVVRGGSFADQLTSLAVHTRGAQPPEWCTPVLGFRLVLAER